MSSVSPSDAFLHAKLGVTWNCVLKQSPPYGYISYYSVEKLIPELCLCGDDHFFYNHTSSLESCPLLPQDIVNFFQSVFKDQSPDGYACYKCKSPINDRSCHTQDPIVGIPHKRRNDDTHHCDRRVLPKLASAVFAFLLLAPSVRAAIADCPSFTISRTTATSLLEMKAWLLEPSIHPETNLPTKFTNLQNVLKVFPFMFAQGFHFTPECLQHLYPYRSLSKRNLIEKGISDTFVRARNPIANNYRSQVAAAAQRFGIVLADDALNDRARPSTAPADGCFTLAPAGTTNPFYYAARGGGLSLNPTPPPTRPPPYDPRPPRPPRSNANPKPYDRPQSHRGFSFTDPSEKLDSRVHTVEAGTRRNPLRESNRSNYTFNIVNLNLPSGSTDGDQPVFDIHRFLGISPPPPSPK